MIYMQPIHEFFFIASLVLQKEMGIMDYVNFRDETSGGRGFWSGAGSVIRHVWNGLKAVGQVAAMPFRKYGNTGMPGNTQARTVSNALDSKAQFKSQADAVGGIPVAVGFKDGKPVFENRRDVY